ncbi:hypothetical protein [Treponema zioleckii]|uniref:hypothetical protein n=1 Tax=Treponema zioleckii TaxID=331680 RepID=UPI00168B71C0|nr:hypothetical protein [Treponema zioleckii]
MASKANTSLAEQLSAARLMADGLKQKADAVSGVGITEAKVKELENLTELLASQNSEQEALKAALKNKTAAVDETRKKLSDCMSTMKKLVKVVVDKNDWVAFGISDKQ